MILPIIAYGSAVLKKRGVEVQPDYPDLKVLIDNMYETMYHASGIGLAAPQIGLSIRLFIVDTIQLENEKEPHFKGMKKVFINPTILSQSGAEWKFEEGCLSIPTIRGDVFRQPDLVVRYQDENFQWHEEALDDMNARVVQHEYDHIDGILFTDKLQPLKKKMIQGKLKKIMKGDVKVDYKMKFPLK